MATRNYILLRALCLTVILEIRRILGADLVISVPGNLDQEGVTYRLDYLPPHGYPPPNTTIASNDIQNVIKFSEALPGTKYYFGLYYSNSSNNTLTWTANFTTVPDPPSNLSIDVYNGTTVNIFWRPPVNGSYSSFKLLIIPLNIGGGSTATSDANARSRKLPSDNVEGTSYLLHDLIPGGSYQVQAFTILEDKESVAYTSRNFTTKPSTPGKFIVWFRNETTLLVLWQPPFPPYIYTHYKVSISPMDANDSVLYVEKEGEPPGPAQAAFKGLVPGRAYNISVQTMSEDKISSPTTAQYRTIPLKPSSVHASAITTTSFILTWDEPNDTCEFDTYQITISAEKKKSTTIKRETPTSSTNFSNLQPGRTYPVLVKTVSGKVSSWPTTTKVTLKPLPVSALRAHTDEQSGNISISWQSNLQSVQDHYVIEYQVKEVLGVVDSDTLTTNETAIELSTLLPGRKYNITVYARSEQMSSDGQELFVQTRPSTPIIQHISLLPTGLNISWLSDVNTLQDSYLLVYVRKDTNVSHETRTPDSHLILKDLYPGAGYLVKIYAISGSVYSRPYEYFQPVFPRPPQHMQITRHPSSAVNHIVISWTAPQHTLISEYAVRYKTASDQIWVTLPSISAGHTIANLTNLTHGERYTIQVNSVSYNVESNEPQQLNYTVPPNAVTAILSDVHSKNITLRWRRPDGRVESYVVNCWQTDLPADVATVVLNDNNFVSDDGEENFVSFVAEDLMPGDQYTFKIYTVSYEMLSPNVSLTVRTVPLIHSELFMNDDELRRDALKVRYSDTPQSVSLFDAYRFAVSESVIEERLVNDTNHTLVFNSLRPGHLYNITMWTVSYNIKSLPLEHQYRLRPDPVMNINATHISDSTIALQWTQPDCEFNAFKVKYLTPEGVLVENLTISNYTSLGDLRPHRNYTFTVTVGSGVGGKLPRFSPPVSATFETKESVPGRVERFEPTDVRPNDIVFEWSLPVAEQNGVISKFIITYQMEGSESDTIIQREFPPTSYRGVIKNLRAGKTYIFRIQGQTRVGKGPVTVVKQTMPILAPPKPGMQVVPTEVRKTTTSIQIRFRRNYFSDMNGPVRHYTVVVAEDDSKNASGLEMPSWRDVQAYSIWPPYQVLEPFYPFENSSVYDFTIGGDVCSVRHIGYCNGPLKSGATYRVKIRAFTAADKFTDTNYSFPIRTDQDNTDVLLGIFIPLSVVCTATIAVVYWRRRRSHVRKAKSAGGGGGIGGGIGGGGGGGPSDTMSLPESMIETSRPTTIENFIQHYRVMSADSDFRFSEEFEELKHVGRDQPCSAADLPCNRSKNRFTNILPYDHSRFKLQPVDDEEGSDYINANFVPGHNSPREFIVTQGPLHATRDDFWRMVWESNSRAIVMLTRCVEKGREKCDHYWPFDTLPVYYGDISVQILNETRYPDWNVTELMVGHSGGDQQRVVRHFHFTTWPDFGVPNPPHTLVRFVRAFRERVVPDQRPIVVHCSAGVGRSGTFISLDRILQQILISDYVDIFGIVFAMRKERVWMVQTEQQYICIYQCLLAVLEGTVCSGPAREIHENQSFEDDEGIVESGM